MIRLGRCTPLGLLLLAPVRLLPLGLLLLAPVGLLPLGLLLLTLTGLLLLTPAWLLPWILLTPAGLLLLTLAGLSPWILVLSGRLLLALVGLLLPWVWDVLLVGPWVSGVVIVVRIGLLLRLNNFWLGGNNNLFNAFGFRKLIDDAVAFTVDSDTRLITKSTNFLLGS